MPGHTLESSLAYWVCFDIACLKQDLTKGLTNLKEEQDIIKVRAMERDARFSSIFKL